MKAAAAPMDGWAVAMIEWNPPLAVALLAMISAQAFKFLSGLVLRRRADFTRLTGTGGMPSAHAATVMALSTAVGLTEGWGSALFGVSLIFALVTMYDATGIRRAAGRQARVLNRMLEELKEYHTLEGERLMELLGHTPLEVLVGAGYGILLAFVLCP
ncbi:MAG TPA: divergent PAP2 family protein [Longimicrobiaceae bacterium]|nr:divergent PAP2 family protein [Longimicrobiaceae bacterium]